MPIAEISKTSKPGRQLKDDLSQIHGIVVKSVNDIIGITDRDGSVIYMSPSVEKILGWTPEDRKGKNGIDLAHEDDVPIILETLNKLNTKKEVTFEYRCLTKQGDYVWLENSIRLITGPFDKQKYMIFVCRDIQKRKELESELIKTAQELSDINRVKDKLLTLIAHDLKNPIFSIITLTDFLKKKLTTLSKNQLADFIAQINDSSKGAYIVLENLLQWVKTHNGDHEYNPEKIQLESVVIDCWNLTKFQADAKNIELKRQIPADLFLVADYNMLDTIIRNLISNAVKFTPQDGKITVTAKQSEAELIFSIKDTGVGMTREQQQFLFSIDSRKKLSTITTSHGSGLGLILCKDLMSKHGGRITVLSKIGLGTTISLHFPQNKF